MGDFNELISIVMPAYNSEKYICDSIESVINQSYENWELIVIDDNSSDSTFQIVEFFKEKDSRIRLYKNLVNSGVSKSRNKAISLAKGNWIAFLDSDDLWTKNKLKKQVDMIKYFNAEFIFTGSSFIDENGQAFVGGFEVPNLVDFKKLKKQNVISCSSVLIKKTYVLNVKMENDKIHEDYAVWLKILKSGVLAYGLNEKLLIYRISRSSKSGNKLKTFSMTYNVFRFVGLNRVEALYSLSCHIILSSIKYFKIYTKH